jgi:hypothetical protein
MPILCTSADRSKNWTKVLCTYRPGFLVTLYSPAAGNPVTSLFAFPYLRIILINAPVANRSFLKVISHLTTAHIAKPEELPTTTDRRQMNHIAQLNSGCDGMQARKPHTFDPYKTAQNSRVLGPTHPPCGHLKDELGFPP